MGGWSGTELARERAIVVGDYRCIDIRRWRRQGLLRAGESFSWQWGDIETCEKLASIDVHVYPYRVVLSYQVREPGKQWQQVDEIAALAFTTCHYGGQRPWFLCPGCTRRVSILYIVDKYFLCRHCNGLSYQSQRFDRGLRALLRAQKIRFKLGGDYESAFFPDKPKRMRWKTYLGLMREAERALTEYVKE